MSAERFTVTRSDEYQRLGSDRTYGATQHFDENTRAEDDEFHGKVNVAEM